MKTTTKLFFTAAAALALGASAQAQSSVIEITGATAFRAGTLDSINAGFIASGAPFKVAFTGTTYNASSRAILRGNFRCSNGDTLTDVVIRTSFSGSTEGLRALDNAGQNTTFDESYFTVASIAALSTVANANSGTPSFNGATEKAPADIAFSDVEAQSVPTIDSSDFVSSPVGAVTFTMLTNDSTTVAPFNNLTNVSSQNFRALMTNGILPLSFFTGIPADADDQVVAVGRNDGSGTRVVYLAETGFGATNLVQQFIASNTTSNGSGGTGTTGSGVINTVQQVPAGSSSETDTFTGTGNTSTNFGTANQSTVFGNPVAAGNGGYASGSQLRRIFGYSSKSTSITAGDGSPIAPAAPIALVTALATADAIGAISQGARALTYDGYGITPAAPLSTVDKDKVRQGQYTLWSFEQIVGKNLGASEQCVFDTVVANIGPIIELDGTGIDINTVVVDRTIVGATVQP